MSLSDEKSQAVEKALRANPMHADADIAKSVGVSKTFVREMRLDLGLWTPRRVRYRDGKAEVYQVSVPAGLTADQRLIEFGISDNMIRQLHSLSHIPSGSEAWQLICDILDISFKET